MNPFLLPSRQRLGHWRAFRSSLAEMAEEAQLGAVAHYFAQAPIASFAYDAEACESWPTPWEMISTGYWCKNSVAIGMEFTLRLAGWSPDRLKLVLIRDAELCDEILVLAVDGSLYLNYEYGRVVPIPDTPRVVLASSQHDGQTYRRCA